jgi:glycosyltransferase involved in cell wall biosynthesis
MLSTWSLSRSARKKRLVARLFENEHLHTAACLRATSEDEAGHFRAYGLRGPIAVVPNGVELPFVASRSRNDHRRRVLFLSRLHPVKGIEFLLKAWALSMKYHREWELVIAGPDESNHRSKMELVERALGLTNVIWLDAVQGDAKSALYRSADLFILPTHTENFGLVVAEALAHEVPVITTKNAPWEGLCRHRCGWWVDLSDNALALALDEAMSLSDAERDAMGARGRVWMERDFAWPAIGKHMYEVYAWVLGGGAPPSCVVTD